jgi:hypothetical protein
MDKISIGQTPTTTAKMDKFSIPHPRRNFLQRQSPQPELAREAKATRAA